MKKQLDLLQKILFTDENNLNDNHLEIIQYIKKELLNLKHLTVLRIEELKVTDKFTECYEDIITDFNNEYKMLYFYINNKMNKINIESDKYIENDIFKLICVYNIKQYIDNLYDYVLKELNIDKDEMEKIIY